MRRELQYEDIPGAIIGCAMQVHRTVGSGFQESIHQRALAIEMSTQGLSYVRECDMDIHYRGEVIGARRVDFLVGGVVLVELKAITQLDDVHLAQAINYLEAFNLEIGLLINFGAKSLQFKRLLNCQLKNPTRLAGHPVDRAL